MVSKAPDSIDEIFDAPYGLILMGGQSTRMGRDKSKLDYHGRPHGEHLFKLLSDFLPKVYVSVRPDQEVSFTNQLVPDQFDIGGPLNGILSAMTSFPNKSWLVLAVDLPFISPPSISRLLESRNSNYYCTAFALSSSRLPEPLAAIWEAHGQSELKNYVEGGGKSPRDFLMHHGTPLVYPENDLELMNANTPEEYAAVKSNTASDQV